MKPSSLRGFTLIEMLVVIAIIGLLAAMVVGSVGKGIERATTLKTISNLRQLHIANTQHALHYNGYYVPHRLFAAEDSDSPDTFWLDNSRFGAFLLGEDHNGWDDWPSVYKSGSTKANWVHRGPEGYIAKMSIALSLGGWTQHFVEGAYSMSDLSPYPRMIMFGESAQWLIHGGRVDQSPARYDDRAGAPFGTMAFRNNGRAGVVRVAGDASLVSYADVLPRSAHPDVWPGIRPSSSFRYR